MLNKHDLILYIEANRSSVETKLSGLTETVDLEDMDNVDQSMSLSAHLVFLGAVYERLKNIVVEGNGNEVASCMRYLTQLRYLVDRRQLNQNMIAARYAIENLLDGMADIIDPQGIRPT